MGMSLGGGGGKNPPPIINVTPLVDVVLVVLVIFMLVTPMLTKTFWLNVPKKPDENAKAAPPSRDTPLVLTLNKGGVIRMNKITLQKEELATRIPRMLAGRKRAVIYFDAHDGASYEEAIEVMDLARSGGAKSIAILTEPVAK